MGPDVGSRLQEVEQSLNPGGLMALDRLHDPEPGTLSRGFVSFLHRLLGGKKEITFGVGESIWHKTENGFGENLGLGAETSQEG